MIYERGECGVDTVNDANIPVNIHIDDMSDKDNWCEDTRPNVPAQWRLMADNYMPRRGHVSDDGLEVYSDNKDELIAIIRGKILPLYQVAVSEIEAMIDGTSDSLYYWS